MTLKGAVTGEELHAGAVLFDLVGGGPLAAAVHAAVRIGVADHLAGGPRTVTQLASATGSHVPSLGRLLRALASRGVFREEPDGSFALTPAADLLRREAPLSLRPFVELSSANVRTWEHLTRGVRSGDTTFSLTFGEEASVRAERDPARAQLEDDAAHALARLWADAVLDAWDFTTATEVVDVGGGLGALLASLAERSATVRGMLVERAPIAARARVELQARGVYDRVEAIEGDFFDELPATGDVYVLQRCLESWPDEAARAILKTVRRAMNPGAPSPSDSAPLSRKALSTTLPSASTANPSAPLPAQPAPPARRGRPARLVVIEMLVPRDSAPSPSTLADLDRLLVGGQLRTRDEIERLLRATGFGPPLVIATKSPLSLLVTSVA